MRRGSFSLAEYPTDMVRLACKRCHRRGQYRKANLLERFPADTPLPDLRHMLAQCERHHHLDGGCGVYFPGGPLSLASYLGAFPSLGCWLVRSLFRQRHPLPRRKGFGESDYCMVTLTFCSCPTGSPVTGPLISRRGKRKGRLANQSSPAPLPLRGPNA
jgi:hypothetical protein